MPNLKSIRRPIVFKPNRAEPHPHSAEELARYDAIVPGSAAAFIDSHLKDAACRRRNSTIRTLAFVFGVGAGACVPFVQWLLRLLH